MAAASEEPTVEQAPDEDTLEHAAADDLPEPVPAEPHPADEILPHPQFPVRPLGYDRGAVDAYVEHARDALADALAAHTPEVAVSEALDRLGEETSAVLRHAHQVADEVTARAYEEAEERRRRAELEAAELQQAAEDRVAALDVELDKLWQERQRLLADMDRISEDLHALVTAADERFPVEEEPESEAEATEPPPAGDADGDEPLEPDPDPAGSRSAAA